MTQFFRFLVISLFVLLLGCATTEFKSSDDVIVSKVYYSTGILKAVWETQYGKLNGIKREYNELGILMNATQYRNDEIDGFQNSYYEDGSIWTKEIYDNGEMIQKLEYNMDGYLISGENK